MGRASGNAMGFLTRLRKDVRGNTLAIMAAVLIPLAAFSGSAIDMARLYVVKVRLQQACDAGVLAGRKAMTDTDPTTPLDATATAAAQTFFTNNFRSGWFQNNSVLFTPSKTSDAQVSGTASTTVPMTIMSMFGVTPKPLNVACEARYDVADADIMFVLDTTGSMACVGAASSCGQSVQSYTREDGTTGYYVTEASGSKLSGLRSAVLSFYDTLTANIDSQTHIRYGFVTYTSTVNVGYSLPANYLVNTKWTYQSRQWDGNDATSSTSQTNNGKSQNNCTTTTITARSPATGYDSNGQATIVTQQWKSNKCYTITTTYIPEWYYGPVNQDVSKYVQGQVVTDPTEIPASNSVKWQGCIEERQTTASSSFDAANLPPDMDPDLAPVASVDSNGVPTSSDTRWRPMWPDVIYDRGSPTTVTTGTNYANLESTSRLQSGYVSCGKKAQRLTTMARTDVSNYVNGTDFKAQGGTYHDTGMIWGTRFISPTGPFATDTAAWPGHQAPNRYIVFMTDGEMAPNDQIYGLYGIEEMDRRVTGSNYSDTNDLNYHNARFVAECQAAKNRNITVFVVGFGQTLNSQLTACASPGQAYYASDNASLTTAFKQIANQVAQLRISK